MESEQDIAIRMGTKAFTIQKILDTTPEEQHDFIWKRAIGLFLREEIWTVEALLECLGREVD